MSESASVRSLTVRYGTTTALHDVNATFERGTVTTLVGHNGSGKSTMLQSLAGIVRPTHGTVETHDLRISYVPQRSDVNDRMTLSVGEVVAMGTWPRRGILGRADAADRRAVDDAVARLKLTDLRTRRLAELSGGQRQRALLAQAIVEHGDLVLLDEPTTGLDTEAREIINSVVDDEVSRGAVVVIATHDVDDAGRSDVTITLGGGEILSSTRPAARRRRGGRDGRLASEQ